jgi:hypothetical protein
MVNVNLNDVDDKLFWEICMEVGYPWFQKSHRF